LETQEPRRFLAPLGKPRDYVDRPELAVQHEPECVGPAIVENYAEVNRLIFTQQHAVDVAQAQLTRPLLSAENRIKDIRRRAKFAHVDLSREMHLMQRDLERARVANRKPPKRVLERCEGLEALLDGIAA
jgi:hypothetical protein